GRWPNPEPNTFGCSAPFVAVRGRRAAWAGSGALPRHRQSNYDGRDGEDSGDDQQPLHLARGIGAHQFAAQVLPRATPRTQPVEDLPRHLAALPRVERTPTRDDDVGIAARLSLDAQRGGRARRPKGRQQAGGREHDGPAVSRDDRAAVVLDGG